MQCKPSAKNKKEDGQTAEKSARAKARAASLPLFGSGAARDMGRNSRRGKSHATPLFVPARSPREHGAGQVGRRAGKCAPHARPPPATPPHRHSSSYINPLMADDSIRPTALHAH
jgi:hypothetical protein